jgi:hypothetical protein
MPLVIRNGIFDARPQGFDAIESPRVMPREASGRPAEYCEHREIDGISAIKKLY